MFLKHGRELILQSAEFWFPCGNQPGIGKAVSYVRLPFAQGLLGAGSKWQPSTSPRGQQNARGASEPGCPWLPHGKNEAILQTSITGFTLLFPWARARAACLMGEDACLGKLKTLIPTPATNRSVYNVDAVVVWMKALSRVLYPPLQSGKKKSFPVYNSINREAELFLPLFWVLVREIYLLR